MWYDTLLNKFHCDESSIMGLVALAQEGRQGYREANSIIGKIIKKANDNIGLDNPSAFLARNIENARRTIRPQGSKYAGMGGWDCVV